MHRSTGMTTIDDIRELRSLETGWDSYSALPIADGPISLAEFVVAQLGDLLGSPKVVPIADGGLQFEWDDGTEMEFVNADDAILSWEDGEDVHVVDVRPLLTVKPQ